MPVLSLVDYWKRGAYCSPIFHYAKTFAFSKIFDGFTYLAWSIAAIVL